MTRFCKNGLSRGEPDLAARLLLDELVSRGFTVEARDGRVYVSPSARLDEADRYRIRANRDGLWAIVAVWHRVVWDGDVCRLEKEQK